MLGPALIACALLCLPMFVDKPLWLYAAVCHFSWAEDACTESMHSLLVNLYNPKNCPTLLCLQMADLLALFKLHHEQCKQFRQCIAKPPFLTDAQLGDAVHCLCCHDLISYIEWHELWNAMFAKLEICPAGDTMLGGLEAWPVVLTCWPAAPVHMPA